MNGRLHPEMLDISMQDICDDVVIVTAFFHIHLPIVDTILSRETARLALVYHLEGHNSRIVNSGISRTTSYAGSVSSVAACNMPGSA